MIVCIKMPEMGSEYDVVRQTCRRTCAFAESSGVSEGYSRSVRRVRTGNGDATTSRTRLSRSPPSRCAAWGRCSGLTGATGNEDEKKKIGYSDESIGEIGWK